jgi:hypothetical protein
MSSCVISPEEEVFLVKSLEDLTSIELSKKLSDDMKKGKDISWMDNRFFTCKDYFDILDNLSEREKISFQKILKKTPIKISSTIPYDELLKDFEIESENNDYQDFQLELENDLIETDFSYGKNPFNLKKGKEKGM